MTKEKRIKTRNELIAKFECSCVDNSGSWGRGGVFTALMNLSSSIPDAFEKAHECSDLHMGDLHLIELEGLYSTCYKSILITDTQCKTRS